jgi:hypothetical protein
MFKPSKNELDPCKTEKAKALEDLKKMPGCKKSQKNETNTTVVVHKNMTIHEFGRCVQTYVKTNQITKDKLLALIIVLKCVTNELTNKF